MMMGGGGGGGLEGWGVCIGGGVGMVLYRLLRLGASTTNYLLMLEGTVHLVVCVCVCVRESVYVGKY